MSSHSESISLPNNYRELQQRARFFQEIVTRAEALPGVRSASVTDNLPLSGEDASRPFRIVGDSVSPSEGKLAAEHRRISSRYFDAMGITLARGRVFTENDNDEATGVVIINEALARRFMPNQDPLGKQIVIDDGPPRPREVVGIVRDVKHFSLDAEARPEMYAPHLDRPWPNMTLVIRAAAGDPADLVAAARGEITTLDKSIPVANVKKLDQYVAASTGPQRFSMFLLGGFAVGLVGALVATRVMQSLLYEVSVNDPFVFLGVTALLIGVALLACFVPARRATRVDPIIALKYD